MDSDMGSACETFVSAPIRLAARIVEQRRLHQQSTAPRGGQPRAAKRRAAPPGATYSNLCCLLLAAGLLPTSALAQMAFLNSQLVSNYHESSASGSAPPLAQAMRQHAHYLKFVPSSHFSYTEGRQSAGRSLDTTGDELAASESQAPQPAPSSHIYKRSSALLPASLPAANGGGGGERQSLSSNPLRRRMMAPSGQLGTEQAHQKSNWLGVGAGAGDEPQASSESQGRSSEGGSGASASSQLLMGHNNRKQSEREQELLRQKQHIQYHDQWPSMAGKCHKRTLNFCASVLPFNTTTFPNIIGDTNRFEVKRSLPFFGFLAKSSCNKRLDELLCLLLEPPCSANSGLAIPPCKKFCRLALEGCNEYIPATLALSSVFDCRQYPDSNDPSVCVNLAQGGKCADDEFKCPDKTCIPRNWLCDGVRDCIFAADEANCTGTAQVSVCSTEEFKCDGKCVPKAWKCDGERDCLDGSDEAECDLRPRCGPDRFKCADGNGCIPKRWVCDGKAECRDGSDEMNCDQRECSENDFKCDNGICIPKLWRCDRQSDCRDGSDERNCIYPEPPTTTTTTTSTTTTTTAATSDSATSAAVASTTPDQPALTTHELETLDQGDYLTLINATSSYRTEQQQQPEQRFKQAAAPDSASDQSSQIISSGAPAIAGSEPANQAAGEQQLQRQQLEFSLNGDVSRTIQLERDAAAAAASTVAAPSTPQVTGGEPAQQHQQAFSNQPELHEPVELARQTTPGAEIASADFAQPSSAPLAKEMKKFDYELLASSSNSNNNLVQLNELPVTAPHEQQLQPQQRPPLEMNLHEERRRGHKFIRQQMGDSEQEVGGQQQQQQRLPIYRSFFKSFKGGQARGSAGRPGREAAGERRHVVAIARRRRDRHQVLPLMGVGLPIAQQRVSAMEAPAHKMDARPLEQRADGPPAFHQAVQVAQTQANNQQHQQGAPAGLTPMQVRSQQQHQHAGAAVASYLQLLNSRYNLRLPRIVASSQQAAPS